MAPIVVARGLSRSYGRTAALAPLDFELGPGITGLLGPNGAGKTTLLRILATSLAPSAGELRVLGHDPSRPEGRLAIRQRLGYAPQELGLYPNFTVFEFVDYLAILKEHTETGARHDEVRRVVDAVGLPDVRSTKLRKLSGGMRRRVILAQALLGDPAIIVLDEPTVGLDPEQRLRFRHLVSAQSSNRCVVLSTHVTEDVEALCERVIVLDGGAIRFDGSPAGLAEVARDRVWVADDADRGALVSWRTGDGRHRMIGEPPAGVELLAPTVEDGYLVLSGGRVPSGRR